MLHWEGEVDGLAPGDTPIKKYTSEPGGWLGGITAKPGFLTRGGRGRPGRPFEACREVHVPEAHKVAVNRRKPILGPQFGLLADKLIGKGQCHSKFFLLRFRRFVKGGEGPEFVVRLVVSSGNCRPCAYAALPMRRELVGLWWADFPEVEDAAPSAFRDALLRHCRALVSARTPTNFDFSRGLAHEVTKDGVTKTERVGRVKALERYAELVDACKRADFALADAAKVRLVAHEPGVHSKGTNVAADALRGAFAEAHAEAGGGALNCGVVVHSANGFLTGPGRQRLDRLKDALAPGGGTLNVFWPENGDVQVLKDRAREDVGRKHASRDATLERLKTVCDGEALTRLRVPMSAGQRGADKFVWTPHLMLYVYTTTGRRQAAPALVRKFINGGVGVPPVRPLPRRRERHPDGRRRARGPEFRARRLRAAGRSGPSAGGLTVRLSRGGGRPVPDAVHRDLFQGPRRPRRHALLM